MEESVAGMEERICVGSLQWLCLSSLCLSLSPTWEEEVCCKHICTGGENSYSVNERKPSNAMKNNSLKAY